MLKLGTSVAGRAGKYDPTERNGPRLRSERIVDGESEVRPTLSAGFKLGVGRKDDEGEGCQSRQPTKQNNGLKASHTNVICIWIVSNLLGQELFFV